MLLHRTEVDDVPLGLAEFRGRLLVAVGATLRMYDLGKRKLLRKTEAAVAPTLITKVEVVGDRIFVADAAMSVHLARYVRDRNRLAVFADDPVGRCVTAFAPPAGTLRISIINDLKTPPKPKPGSQRAGARGKVQSAAAQRKLSAAQRQVSGRGGTLAGARGASLASRLGEARVVKSPAGVAKKKANALRSVFPAGMFVSGKKQVASGKAAKKRGNAKRR